MSACTRRQQYALPDPQPSKHEALNECWFDAGPASQTVARIGPAFGQRLVFAGSVVTGREDIKTVAQLIEP